MNLAPEKARTDEEPPVRQHEPHKDLCPLFNDSMMAIYVLCSKRFFRAYLLVERERERESMMAIYVLRSKRFFRAYLFVERERESPLFNDSMMVIYVLRSKRVLYLGLGHLENGCYLLLLGWVGLKTGARFISVRFSPLLFFFIYKNSIKFKIELTYI